MIEWLSNFLLDISSLILVKIYLLFYHISPAMKHGNLTGRKKNFSPIMRKSIISVAGKTTVGIMDLKL